MRYRLDGSWRRLAERVVLGGSPHRLFRLTTAGARHVDDIATGADLTPSTLTDRLLDAGAIHPRPTHSRRGDHRFTAEDVTIVTPQLGGEVKRDGRVTVDDGSRPPLDGATIRCPENRGPAAARNAGRPLISTPLVAYVDADVELLEVEMASHGGESWLDALVPHFDDPRVGLVAPRVMGDDGSSLDLGPEPGRVRAMTRISYVPAAAIVVRVDALDDVGGFDETLRFGEDVDFVWRLDQAGWRCRYEPDSVVWHRPRPTQIGRLRQQIGYGGSAPALALRHPRLLAPYRSNGWTAASWGLVAVGHPITGAAIAVGSAAALVRRLPDVPAHRSFALALRGHLGAARQLAAATRRAWWPIAGIACLVSKRARLWSLAAFAVDPRATPVDIAYGVGLWREMFRLRSFRAIVPHVGRWPSSADQPPIAR